MNETLLDENKLTQIGIKYNTDKATYHNFTDFYDKLFNSDKDNVKIVMEFGVASGSSIKMWREYFKLAKIYCYDINLECQEYVNKLPDVVFNYLNQDSKYSIKNAISSDIKLGTVDIIIEDGGHFSTQQRNTLEVMWSYLKSGGIYVVEDIHTNIKHWYPDIISWGNRHYWDEIPTLFESLSKLQLGIPINNSELNIPINEIKQTILWTQPNTTSALLVLIKK